MCFFKEQAEISILYYQKIIIMKKQILYSGCILLLGFASCDQKKDAKKEALYNALEEIDKNTGNFNPSFFNDSTGYIVIKAVYKNGSYVPDSVAAFKRSGKFPYRPEKKPTMPFVVSYYNANAALIGSYSIENPALYRTCEEGNGGILMTENLTFEILLPADPAIKRYGVSIDGKEVFVKNLPVRVVKEGNNNPGNNKDTIR